MSYRPGPIALDLGSCRVASSHASTDATTPTGSFTYTAAGDYTARLPHSLQVGDAVLALSDGRMACQRAREDGLRNLILLDLAHDYRSAKRIAISHAAGIDPLALEQGVALLQRAGLTVSLLSDSPALAVLRTVAMLANEAADALLQGAALAAECEATRLRDPPCPPARHWRRFPHRGPPSPTGSTE